MDGRNKTLSDFYFAIKNKSKQEDDIHYTLFLYYVIKNKIKI